MLKHLFITSIILSPLTVNALDSIYDYKPATIDCVLKSAHRQQVPANVLLAISSIESGKNGQLVKNKNGSLDLGHFQINTVHWRPNGILNRLGIKQQDVQWRGCYNAEIAAYLLRINLNERSNQDFWTRAANYHSRSPKANQRYKAKLIQLSGLWATYLKQQNRQHQYQLINVSY